MTMSGVDGQACWTSLTNETDGVRPPPRPSEPQISSRSALFCTALKREISSRVCQLGQRPREMVVGKVRLDAHLGGLQRVDADLQKQTTVGRGWHLEVSL